MQKYGVATHPISYTHFRVSLFSPLLPAGGKIRKIERSERREEREERERGEREEREREARAN